MAVLAVDYNAPVDPLLDFAEGKLHDAMDRTFLAASTPKAEAMNALTHAMGSLDQLISLVDGIADVSGFVVIKVNYGLISLVDSPHCQGSLDAPIFSTQGVLDAASFSHATSCSLLLTRR